MIDGVIEISLLELCKPVRVVCLVSDSRRVYVLEYIR
jgi:hypothetical protein